MFSTGGIAVGSGQWAQWGFIGMAGRARDVTLDLRANQR
jgi:hypothetical protein